MWIFVVGVVLGVVFMIHADIVPGTGQKSIHLNMENLPLRILFIPTTVSYHTMKWLNICCLEQLSIFNLKAYELTNCK